MACSMVTIYVNWSAREIVGEHGKNDWIEELADKYLNDTTKFSEWLDEHYNTAEVFHMTDKDKIKALACYRNDVYDEAKEDFEREFDEEEVKIE